MKYYLNLFSPSTWKAFNENGSHTSGFSIHQKGRASKIKVGSIYLCYLVKLSRWVGALKILSEPYEDTKPIFSKENDKFIYRFKVEPLVILEPELGIPVEEDFIWNELEWTKNIKKRSVGWGANFQSSLREMPNSDAEFLLNKLEEQNKEKKIYELSKAQKRIIQNFTFVRTQEGIAEVEIPEKSEYDEEAPQKDFRESAKVQLLLAEIGAKMGFNIWIPRTDRTYLEDKIKKDTKDKLLDDIPLGFDETTMRTVENIDVIWLKKKSIVRAFEVEGTTAIYSGILRMADLLSSVPNLDIKLHIVASSDKKEKVFNQIHRPTFATLEGQLVKKRTFLSYDNVKKLSENTELKHLKESVIEEYIEARDY